MNIPCAKYTLLTPTAVAPRRGEPHAAGLDVCADLLDAEGQRRVLFDGKTHHTANASDAEGRPVFNVLPQHRVIIPTGIAMITSPDLYPRVAPRSGLAIKKGLAILGGVIDCTYTGEIGVIVHNTDPHDVLVISQGERIAQLVLTHVWLGNPEHAETLEEGQRGAAGFGSTGQF